MKFVCTFNRKYLQELRDKGSYLDLVTGRNVLPSLLNNMVERVFFMWSANSRCLKQNEQLYIVERVFSQNE